MARPESMAALLIQLIGARVSATAASPAHQGRLLEGLNGVLVLGSTLSPELAEVGLTPSILRDTLLSALHGASVPVLEPREGLVLGAVSLSLAGVQVAGNQWAICGILELKQRASLCREPSVSFDAATWTGTATATCSDPRVEEVSRHHQTSRPAARRGAQG